MSDSERPLLVVRHAAWEGPHRILRAFRDRPVRIVDRFEPGGELPEPETVAGAVFMGGPMSVNDSSRLPQLAAEVAWIEQALQAGVPVLGVCLGSQLIARALGARVRPGPAREIGWAPVEILDASDRLLGALAPRRVVLHWHGEVYDTPPGAVALARSEQTACQAFRAGSAWGVLFHAEADRRLVDSWLDEPSMAEEAEEVLGPDAAARLRAGADAAEPQLLAAADAMFVAFAAHVAAAGRPPTGITR